MACHSSGKLGLYRSTQLDQAHNNILSSQRALYLRHRLLIQASQALCPVGPQDTLHAPKIKILNLPLGSKTTAPRRCRLQSPATTPYNGTDSQIQTAQIRSTPDANPSILPNSRTNYRPFRNKARRRQCYRL